VESCSYVEAHLESFCPIRFYLGCLGGILLAEGEELVKYLHPQSLFLELEKVARSQGNC
jgi:hypothetical protein